MFKVILLQEGEKAELICDTFEEARLLKIAFENYGKFDKIEIERVFYAIPKIY